VRLLFIAPNLALGGAERQWALLIPQLISRGHTVEVITLDGRGRFFEDLVEANVVTRCLELRSRFDLVGLSHVLSHGEAADVVISRGPSAQVTGQAVATVCGARHLTTEHTPVGADGEMRSFRRDQAALIRLVAARADRVVGVAAAQVPALVARGYRPERIAIIWNGLGASDVTPTRDPGTVRQELGIADEDFLVLMAAGLRPEKRVEMFLHAIVAARLTNPRIRGILAGGGPGLEALRDESQRLSGVGLLPLGARNDVPDLIHAADAVCLTSDMEALPMILLEAMAVGRPTIATRVGGVSDVVDDGRTGILVPPGDVRAVASAIRAFADDRDLAKAFGEAGQQRQQGLFATERMVDDYERELLNLRRRRSRTDRAPAIDNQENS
jgi:glycosyltransferase involved in cell wall biosynthesis